MARDYQLVSKFYEKNPIVQIGFGCKVSPQKISNQVKAVKRGDGPKAELIDALKGVTQFHTAQEFHQFINNVCVEKELKVRIKELLKYRDHGLTKMSDLVPFEKVRFKRELRLKNKKKSKSAGARFLPTPGDYSIKAILDPFWEEKQENCVIAAKKKRKKPKWARKKLKTGRRLLIQQGCILTVADPKGKRGDSSDSN